MSRRILAVDELFARAEQHGAPFASDPEDEDYEIEEHSPVADDRSPEDAVLTDWEPFGYDDATTEETEAASDGEEDEDEEDDPDDDGLAPDELERSPIVAIAPLPEAELEFAKHEVYGEARAYGAALVRLLPYLRQKASRIAGGDPQLAGDLTQEALIELWEMDASRFDEDDQMYLKKALVNRMLDAAERDFMQEMLVTQARARSFVRLRHEIGPSIHHLGPHRPFTFSDWEEE